MKHSLWKLIFIHWNLSPFPLFHSFILFLYFVFCTALWSTLVVFKYCFLNKFQLILSWLAYDFFSTHHSTPSSSHSSGGRQSEGHHCRSADNQIHSVRRQTKLCRATSKTGHRGLKWNNVCSMTFITNLIKGLVWANDHLWLVWMDSHIFLCLWDSGMLHSSAQPDYIYAQDKIQIAFSLII